MEILLKKIGFRLYLLSAKFDGRFFRLMRRKSLELSLGQSLAGLYLDPDVRITGYENLRLGENFSMHYWGYLSAEGGISIGKNVAIGHHCSILTTEHGFTASDTPIKFQPISKAPVRIDDNVWLGANVTILGGVHLRSGTVVAAGAVVTRSFDEKNIILAGVPASILKRYR